MTEDENSIVLNKRSLTSASCPYCPGPAYGWGMGPDGWAEMKRIHDRDHTDQVVCCFQYSPDGGHIWKQCDRQATRQFRMGNLRFAACEYHERMATDYV
jgi:hypothetical protein